jgi:hypothetical protein
LARHIRICRKSVVADAGRVDDRHSVRQLGSAIDAVRVGNRRCNGLPDNLGGQGRRDHYSIAFTILVGRARGQLAHTGVGRYRHSMEWMGFSAQRHAALAGSDLPREDGHPVADDPDCIDQDAISAARTRPERGDNAHLGLPVHCWRRQQPWLTNGWARPMPSPFVRIADDV